MVVAGGRSSRAVARHDLSFAGIEPGDFNVERGGGFVAGQFVARRLSDDIAGLGRLVGMGDECAGNGVAAGGSVLGFAALGLTQVAASFVCLYFYQWFFGGGFGDAGYRSGGDYFIGRDGSLCRGGFVVFGVCGVFSDYLGRGVFERHSDGDFCGAGAAIIIDF